MSDTDAGRERRIRERAYFLWLEAGSPEGQSVRFWDRAETLEANPLPPETCPSSAAADVTGGGVAGEGSHTDLAADRPSRSVPSSGTAPRARAAPRPLGFLLAIAALFLGAAWVARRSNAREAGRGTGRRAWP
jgi:Protein of unknown function (DUF2934)